MTIDRTHRGPLILSAASITTARNWRDPNDTSREFTRDLKTLIRFAQTAERGKLHNLFFVDHLSWFDVYGNSHEESAKNGVNATRIDPTIAISALANATESIGFAITLSTVSEHPYHFARRLASLDHLSNGRIGWNIVASYLPSVGENLLNGAPLPEHDERYVKTEEYLDTVYELLLSSWRDDAVVYDKRNGVFANPDAIREINHEGDFFDVSGPAITEPTPQRFPLIIQAGTSERGILFAAENAELVFIGLDSADKIHYIRQLAKERFNRDPYSIKFITSFAPFLGKTHEEATNKYNKFRTFENLESNLIYFGGVSGFDLSKHGWDEVVNIEKDTNGIRSTVDNILKRGKKVETKKDIARKWGDHSKFVGTASEIADQIEQIISTKDIDGFNISLTSYPETLDDVVDLLVPELQERGLFHLDYEVPKGTFRENFYGRPGQSFLPGDHPAYSLRWRSGVSKEQFEKELRYYKVLRDERRRGR